MNLRLLFKKKRLHIPLGLFILFICSSCYSIYTMLQQTEAGTLADFRSDGCSLFIDRSLINSDDWCDCCLKHDIAYWKGGTLEEKQVADLEFKNCVESLTGRTFQAEIMYQAVKFGGDANIPTWYRWGYGWEYGRGYKALNDSEKKLVEKKLKKYYKSTQLNPCLEHQQDEQKN